MDARIKELLEQIDSTATAETLTRLGNAVVDLEEAINADDGEQVARSLQELKAITHGGTEQAQLWQEIDRVQDRKRKLAESE